MNIENYDLSQQHYIRGLRFTKKHWFPEAVVEFKEALISIERNEEYSDLPPDVYYRALKELSETMELLVNEYGSTQIDEATYYREKFDREISNASAA